MVEEEPLPDSLHSTRIVVKNWYFFPHTICKTDPQFGVPKLTQLWKACPAIKKITTLIKTQRNSSTTFFTASKERGQGYV
jgi:hypothetical protein